MNENLRIKIKQTYCYVVKPIVYDVSKFERRFFNENNSNSSIWFSPRITRNRTNSITITEKRDFDHQPCL